MFQKFFSLLALGCAFPVSIFAYQVNAVATDSVGEGLPYVSYWIYGTDSIKPVTAAVSTADGVIDGKLADPGKYRIRLGYVGMNDVERTFEVSDSSPVADLGDITMSESARTLQGVTVTAQRPLVVKQIDRLGYDVQADPEMPTANVSDILRKVPMVSVDADGTIKVNGSTNFKIYKNGRPNNSMSRNAKELFKAMPASMIRRVEVITDPGAAFDAEGTTAVLNIVTEDNAAIKGVLGNVNLRYSNLNDYPEGSVWLTSEIDKVTFSAYGGYSHLGGKMTENETSSATYYPDGTVRRSESTTKTKGDITYFGLDASWQPDTLNLFTAEMNGYWFNTSPRGTSLQTTTSATGDVIGSLSSFQHDPFMRYFDIDAAVNYQRLTHRKGETYTISYMLSHTNQSQNGYTDYYDGQGVDRVPYTAIISDYKLEFIEHTFQADWTRIFGRHTIDLGAKGIFRRNHSTNEFEYTGWMNTDNEFKHITNIGALYAQYSLGLGPVNLRAGLRWEYSHLKASYPDGSADSYSSRLNDWVPSAAASWQINDANSLTFNYSTSISRPGISYLNPAVTISPVSESYGNPDLESARRSSMKLTYMLIKPKFNFNISTTYTFVNNGIASVNFLDDNNIIHSTYANIGHTRELGFQAFAQWSPSMKTRLMLNGGVTRQYASQTGMKIAKWAPRGYMQVSQQLPWKITAEASVFVNGASIDGVYGYSTASFINSIYYTIQLRRNFLKEDRLSVSVSAMNPIGPSRRHATDYTVNGDYTGRTDTFGHYAHGFNISIGYRFGSLNAQVKKTAKTIENDDLVGRKSE